MKKNILVLSLALISLCGCHSTSNTPVLTPTSTPSPLVTPTDIPRWMMYEAALLKATIGKDDGLCEWALLGIAEKEVYVWVKCKLRGPIGTVMSVPAAIYLGEDGEIIKVAIPRDGKYYPEDVRSLFPPEVQAKIFSHDTGGIADMEHLEARMENGGPPLIVILGTPMP
jgi:hypothetical protein